MILIPLIGRIANHPSDPIACQAAIARSAGQGRPHRGRRSLALDRSEHGGRLAAFGQGVSRTRHAAFRSIMPACFACIMLALSGVAGHAEQASAPPPDSASVERHDDADPWAASIAEASRRFDIPERWIRAVMGAESNGDTRAVSSKGARGLMQIMPATWDELRARHRLGGDPFDPQDNIVAGTAYLSEMRERYGMPGALAAYNAGPARYEEHKLLGVPLPAETIAYLDKLAPIFGSGPPGLFAGPGGHGAASQHPPLFAIDTAAESLASTSSAESLFATDKRRDRQQEPAETESPDVQTD
ncbi:lytic transglycosylase domain-containing protein [Aquamicrobium sp. LC103]|nr:lytic transglycosylase domain-containing protein [Aquamicrobium sp. LC103]